MTIPRNLSILAEGANATGVLAATNGGTGLSSPGTSGNILTSNGTTWTSSAPSGGAATQGGFRSASNALYISWGSTPNAAAAIFLVQYRIYYLVFVVGQTTTFTKIGTNITTADAGKVLRFGIYNWSNGIATTRVLDAGTVSFSTTGIVEATISQTLSPGVYALALVTDSAAGAIRAASSTYTDYGFQYGWADLSNQYTFCLYETGAAATLPTTATTTPTPQTTTTGAGPILYIRV